MSKRQRTDQGGRKTIVQAKRPIDKELIVCSQTTTTSVVSTTLKTTTFPCTVVGLRWSLAFSSVVASESVISWLIIVVKDGNSANTPSQSNGADMYTPEQNVLAFGVVVVGSTGAATDQIQHIEGTTKTMRKLKQGDVLQLITLNSDVSGATLQGVVQFFCKS